MPRLLALVVHTTTAVLVGIAAWFVLLDTWIGFRIALGGLALAVAVVVRPRLPRRPAGELLTRETAPALFAQLDEVAAQARTTPPRQVVVDNGTGATSGLARGGRYLRVGLPLWVSLGRAGRTALLAEQVGRLGSGAAVVDPVVVTARVTLDEWMGLLHTRHEERDYDEQFGYYDTLDDAARMRVADGLLNLVTYPGYLLARVVDDAIGRSVRPGVERGVAAGALLASRVAGQQGAADLHEGRRRAEQLVADAEASFRRDPDPGAWPDAADPDPVDAEVRTTGTRLRKALRDAARS